MHKTTGVADNIGWLEHARDSLTEYIKVLKGEAEDYTGIGRRQIFLSQLREAMQLDIKDRISSDLQ